MANKIDNGSMSILDVMNELTHGELSQYAFGGADNGIIQECHYPKVMSAINRGINQIQQDLSLIENSMRIKMIEGVLTYPIHSRHSIVNGSHPVKYVDDSLHAPFEDDILRILQVYNKQGRQLPINEVNNIESIYIPQHNVIQNPFARDGDVLGIIYTRFTRPLQVVTEEEAAITYLPIPDYTLPALYAYVSARMTAGITTAQEIEDSGNSMSNYEQIIAKLKYTPAIQEGVYLNTKLTDNGFV